MKQRNNPFKLDKSCAEHGVLNSEYHDVRKTVHNSIKKKDVCMLSLHIPRDLQYKKELTMISMI